MAEAIEKAEVAQTAIQTVEEKPFEIQKFEFQQRAAKLFAMSGLFSDIKGRTPEEALAQAFVKIALGESMGFSPAESMTGIDIIQGRVAVSANMRAARMQRAGYGWDILQLDETACRLRMKFNGQVVMQENERGESVPAVVSFTMKDASTAGLAGKDNYKKNPRNMLFCRAITNAQRWYAPGVLSINILSSEEAVDAPETSYLPAESTPPQPIFTEGEKPSLAEVVHKRTERTTEDVTGEPQPSASSAHAEPPAQTGSEDDLFN